MTLDIADPPRVIFAMSFALIAVIIAALFIEVSHDFGLVETP